MGYETDYNGEIHLKSKKAIRIINYMLDDQTPPFEYCDSDIEIEDDNPKDVRLHIGTYWKDNGDLMLKLCSFVSMLDKRSHGIIECSGEESDDIWRIVVGKGKAIREQGKIIYEKGEEFNEIKIKKQVYKITKNKKLMKELIVESL